MTRTWEDNAAEFAALDTGEGWPFARLVACSVQNNGRGNPGKGTHVPLKVTATEFAVAAGTTHQRVLRYLTCWQRAAEKGHVADADLLTPEDWNDWTEPDMSWLLPNGRLRFGQPNDANTARNIRGDDRDERVEAIREQAEADGVGASKAVDIASNPKALAAAIKADPKTAAAAQAALDDRNHEQAERMRQSMNRQRQADEARAAEVGPPTVSVQRAMGVALEVAAFVSGLWENNYAHTAEGDEVVSHFASSLEYQAQRSRAWRDHRDEPMDQDEFSAGIQTMLDGAA